MAADLSSLVFQCALQGCRGPHTASGVHSGRDWHAPAFLPPPLGSSCAVHQIVYVFAVSLLFFAQLLIGNLFSSPNPLAAYLCTCLSLVGQYAPLLRAVVPRWGPQTLTISTTVCLDLLEMGNAEALPHASRIMKSGS